MTNIKFHNKAGDQRIGIQDEIIKSDKITESVVINNQHVSNNNVFISTDHCICYVNNDVLKNTLKKDNIYVTLFDYETLSSPDDLNKHLTEKNTSFSVGVKTQQPCNSVEVIHDGFLNAGSDPQIHDIKIVNADALATSVIKQFKDSAINDCSNNYDDLVDDH